MSVISNLPDISFVETDVDTILSEIINGYEDTYYESTGVRKKLYPGDPIRIFLYSQALRELQLRIIIDNAAKQNLLKYSSGTFLDNLGAGRNVPRLPSSKARVEVLFRLSNAQSSILIIPKGTRVTPGNNIFFETTEPYEVPIGATEITINMECTAAGTVGNDFSTGQINVLVDPLPWISSVSNIETSQGGADIESDDSFRERIYLAPESYSVAGPSGAYEFFAKEYSSAIADVKVYSPSAGTVDIRVLLKNGEIPSEAFLEGLYVYLSDKNRRPLTDNVIVDAPTIVNYNINLTYYILKSNSSIYSSIQASVNKVLEEYILWQKSRIGRDINPSELIARIINAGAKRVDVAGPVYTSISDTEIAYADNVVVNYGGVEND